MTWWRSWRMPSLVSGTSWMPAAFYSQEVPRGNKCRCLSWADGSCTVSQLNRCVGGLMGVVKICHPQSAIFPKSALSTQIPQILSNSWIQKHRKKPSSSYFSLERWRGLEWVMVPPSAVAWNSEMPANETILMKRQMQGRISVIKADMLHCNQIQYNQWCSVFVSNR